MRWVRLAAKILLSILVLFEVYVAWQFWLHGPPMVATDVRETGPGELSFRLVPVPPSPSDYLVLSVVIVVQVALVGFLWWSKRKIARG
jgi:hypothetical protein